MMQQVSKDRAEEYRELFVSAFPIHEQMDERPDEVFELENKPETPVADFTRQRVIAAYEGVQVWLLNDNGPLQAFYDEDEEWGRTGSPSEVAQEVTEAFD